MLVVLEGLDNSGKTTIAKRLKKEFSESGYFVGYTEEFETPVGKLIKDMSENDEGLDRYTKSFLFAADRQIRLGKYTESDFKNKIIIFDRYLQSAVAYRMAEGIQKDWIKTVNEYFRKPDMIFYIDITPEESKKRSSPDKFDLHYSMDMLKKARDAYLEIIDEYGMICVDGMDDFENVYANVKCRIDEKLRSASMPVNKVG